MPPSRSVAGARPTHRSGSRATREQKQLGEELRARTADAENARMEAQLANEAKSRFLADMSHELRTPLNAILGYSDLLSSGVGGEINTVQSNHVTRIRDSVLHLRDLIDQILSLSRIEAEREDLNVTEFDLARLVREFAPYRSPPSTQSDARARRSIEADSQWFCRLPVWYSSCILTGYPVGELEFLSAETDTQVS